MNRKKIIWTMSIIFAFIVGVIVYSFIDNKQDKIALNETTQNIIEISKKDDEISGEVADECINEWNEYNQYIGEKVENASNNLVENDTHYLLKSVDGYIQVFYVGEDNKEYLYKKTNISTDYLTEEDIEDLNIGIEVVGVEALNKMLEDFE